ncbi:MAG: hypothetical protein ABI664_02145 [bacterium]
MQQTLHVSERLAQVREHVVALIRNLNPHAVALVLEIGRRRW